MSVPNGEKGGKGFIIWTKIAYHNVCMVNTDKEQEGIANIIEARNKYRMLRTRKERTAFITKVARVFKYSRKYVIMLLGKRKKERKGRRGAPKKLREEDVQIIRQLWDLSDYMNAEYFHAGIARWINDLEKEGIEISQKQKERIKGVSYKTIERALKPWRPVAVTARAGNIGCLSKEYGVEFVERIRHVTRPGYICMDTVLHGGRSTAGSFMRSVTWTDVWSGYTLNYAIWNSSFEEMRKAFDYFLENTPFEIVSINVDNGREFFNRMALEYWTKEKGVKVTHSRPMMKNDNAHAEQRNKTHVRRLFARYRIDEESDVRWANLIYRLNNLKYNYMMPCRVLVNRELKKDNQRYRRVYDKAKPPAERLLASPEVSEENKQRIKATAEEYNFVKISVKLKVTLDKFYERLVRRENIYD